jgi:hypothetical protein
MTIMETGKGVVTTGYGEYGARTYDIDFINLDGNSDETQFSAHNIKELSILFKEFCEENSFKTNTVTSIASIN